MPSDVDRIHGEFTDLIEVLSRNGEVSLQSAADDSFRKVLMISAASYFEHRLTEIVSEFVAEMSSPDILVASLVYNKAISRQYHSWFDWERSNANKFFGLFGDEFRSHMAVVIKANPALENAIKAFMELGEGRNMLAHQNFAAYAMQKTASEIYQLYTDAMLFIDTVGAELRACSAKHRQAPPAPPAAEGSVAVQV
jgi:hypothetical protein